MPTYDSYVFIYRVTRLMNEVKHEKERTWKFAAKPIVEREVPDQG